jgi:spore coat polysaccharide biosynthesis predicted glycosyltransferase SpsG
MQIVLRAVCGGDYGWGHWIRTLNVASALLPHLKAHDQLTLVYEGPAQSLCIAHERLGAEDASRVDILSAENWEPLLLRCDTLAIDRLEHSGEQLSHLRTRTNRLIAWDDMGQVAGGADVIIRPQVLPHAAEVRDADARVFCGPEYFPIDRAWLNVRTTYDVDRASSLLVCLGGGTTNRQGYLLVAEALRPLSIAPLTFVLGYQLAQGDLPTRLSRIVPDAAIVGAADLPTLATSTKLAIVGAGFIKLDLAAAGLPMILLCGPDHQLTLGRAFADRGAALCAGRIDQLTARQLADIVADAWADTATRRELSVAARRLVDGRGADRIAPILLSHT